MNALQPPNETPVLASYLSKAVAQMDPAEHRIGHISKGWAARVPATDEIINGKVQEIERVFLWFELRSTHDALGWVYEGPVLTVEAHGVPAEQFAEALRRVSGATTLDVVSQENDVAQVVAFFERNP